MKPWHENLIIIAAIFALTAILPGCATADKSLGHTVAKVTTPGGFVIDWDNTKNLDLVFGLNPESGIMTFTLKSATPEAAMANVAQSNAETASALRDLTNIIKEMIPAAARAGAMAGS